MTTLMRVVSAVNTKAMRTRVQLRSFWPGLVLLPLCLLFLFLLVLLLALFLVFLAAFVSHGCSLSAIMPRGGSGGCVPNKTSCRTSSSRLSETVVVAEGVTAQILIRYAHVSRPSDN